MHQRFLSHNLYTFPEFRWTPATKILFQTIIFVDPTVTFRECYLWRAVMGKMTDGSSGKPAIIHVKTIFGRTCARMSYLNIPESFAPQILQQKDLKWNFHLAVSSLFPWECSNSNGHFTPNDFLADAQPIPACTWKWADEFLSKMWIENFG